MTEDVCRPSRFSEEGNVGGVIAKPGLSLPKNCECPGDQAMEMDRFGKVSRRCRAVVQKRRAAGWAG